MTAQRLQAVAADCALPDLIADTAYNLGDEFGIPIPEQQRKAAVYMGGRDSYPGVPEKRFHYFDRGALRDIMAYWQSGDVCLKIAGDPAVGKTSLIEQFHARMRWPLWLVSCSADKMPYHLFGQLLPHVGGGLRWVDGPVLAAARVGGTVLLDEWNTLMPETASSLNAIMERYPIAIPETGERIKPHPSFRIIATENPVDGDVLVAGRNVQDSASDDRWMYMHLDYLPTTVERDIVIEQLRRLGATEECAQGYAEAICKAANLCRASFKSGSSSLPRPMSTRTMLRWARLALAFASRENPLLYALLRAYGTSSAEAREELVSLFRSASGVAVKVGGA